MHMSGCSPTSLHHSLCLQNERGEAWSPQIPLQSEPWTPSIRLNSLSYSLSPFSSAGSWLSDTYEALSQIKCLKKRKQQEEIVKLPHLLCRSDSLWIKLSAYWAWVSSLSFWRGTMDSSDLLHRHFPDVEAAVQPWAPSWWGRGGADPLRVLAVDGCMQDICLDKDT